MLYIRRVLTHLCMFVLRLFFSFLFSLVFNLLSPVVTLLVAILETGLGFGFGSLGWVFCLLARGPVERGISLPTEVPTCLSCLGTYVSLDIAVFLCCQTIL